MDSSNNRWLLQQLPEWERQGLISSAAAQTLRERYAADDGGAGVSHVIMAALGALLVGTGLIALIGYNWDQFSRPTRLLFAFLPLLVTQVLSLRVVRLGSAAATWKRESVALLQAFAAGACLLLVSQIYNLGGDWPDFLFAWFLLSLPLVWVFRSEAVAIFYLVAIAVWAVAQTDRGAPWHQSAFLYPLLLLGLFPYWPGWKAERPLSVALRWVLAGSALFGLGGAAFLACRGNPGEYPQDSLAAALWLMTLTTAGMTLLPLSSAGIARSTGRKPQVVLGALWVLGYGMAATFREVSQDILQGAAYAMKTGWSWGLLGMIGGFVVLAVGKQRWALLAIASVAFLPLAILPFQTQQPPSGALLSVLAALQLFGIGLTLIVLDLLGRRGSPRFGALLLCLLIIVRLGDSDLSLLTKGSIFLLVGLAFLAFNFFMSRRRQTSLHTIS